MPLRHDTAELVGAIIEAVIFGVYLVFFPVTIYVLVGAKKSEEKRKPINLIMAAISVWLFILTCAHWALDMDRMYQAFIASQNERYGPLTFFLRIWDIQEVLRTGLFVAQLVTFDGVLLFRLYIIWGRNLWVTVLPALTLAGTIASGVGLVIFLHYTRTRPVILYGSALGTWITTVYVLNFATNVICVGLIAFRLIQRNHRLRASGVAPVGGSNLIRILAIIAESATLYCLTNLIAVGGLIAHSNIFFTLASLASPITGISFAFIVLRVGFARAFSPWLGHPSASSGSGVTAALRMPGSEHSVFPMHARITRERTFVDSDVEKDLDVESVEAKRPTLGGRADDGREVV